MRRCRHASASVGVRIYSYGGLKGDILLDDLLVAENSQYQSDTTSPVSPSRSNEAIFSPFSPTSSDDRPETPSFFGINRNSLEKLTEVSAAEAVVANAVRQSAQAATATPEEASLSDGNSQSAETISEGSDTQRLMFVFILGRRMIPSHNDLPNPTKKFARQRLPQGLHKKIMSTLFRPRNWKPPVNRKFFLDSYEVGR